MSTGAVTPAWRDRVAEAVHTGVSAVTPAARATGACLRYACVGAEILRSELPALGITVASTALADRCHPWPALHGQCRERWQRSRGHRPSDAAPDACAGLHDARPAA